MLSKEFPLELSGRVISTLSPTGNLPDCLETIRAAGLDVPASVLEANWRLEQKTGKS